MVETTMEHFLAIGRIQAAVAKEKTVEGALKAGIEVIVSGLHADGAVVWYSEPANKNTVLHPNYSICPIDITAKKYQIGEGMVGKTYQNDETICLLDFKRDADESTKSEISELFPGVEVSSLLCIPLSNKHEKLGCLQVFNTSKDHLFSDDDADMIQIFAGLLCVYIDESTDIQAEWKATTPILSVRDITREFPNGDTVTKVLKGMNIDVYEGEFLVLLGESGCGKSTLLNIIGGLDTATSGTITFMGKDLSHASQEELTGYRRENIGFIFQSYNLMPNLTAKQNLDLIAELVEDPMDSYDALNLVGLRSRADNYPSQLSGGQQQRVSIARALIKNPKIIMADEPTAALDYATSIEVLHVMEEIVRSGATLVMVTHNEEITRMADRVIRVRDGKPYEITINRHPVHAEELVW